MLSTTLAVACLFVQQAAAPPSPPEVPGTPVAAVTLRHIDIIKGDGPSAAPGKQYTVHYTGWLTSGKKFDSSLDRQDPLTFVQGRKQVITGWDIGFEGMNVGGKRRLLIPYQLAYGDKGAGAAIPPQADLIFDVELLAVRDSPDLPAAVDVLVPFTSLETKVLALVNAVPEEKLSWRPAPGVRSFGEIFLHIAYGNRFIETIATKQPPEEELNKLTAEMSLKEKQPVSKAQIIEALKTSFAASRKTMESLRAGGLAHDADFFGQHTTRKGVLTIMDTHMAEHLGQAIAYSRMNGIVPPW